MGNRSSGRKQQVIVAFGGVSPEHEVSVISAQQVLAALRRDRYDAVPLYVAKDGAWYTGDILRDVSAFEDLDRIESRAQSATLKPLPGGGAVLQVATRGLIGRRVRDLTVDAMFLAFHGGAGENGAFQGLCEALGVAYTGSGVLASALGMDKVAAKVHCRAAGVPVVDFVELGEAAWADREDEWLGRLETELGLPLIVKPARLGSSIGIGLASTRSELDQSIEEAFRYDDRIVVELAVRDLTEVNCSVLGDSSGARASVLEQPLPADELSVLTFADKYQRGGEGLQKSRGSKTGTQSAEGMASLDRIIPAPLDESRTEEIRALAVRVFGVLGCAGLARIDFLIDGVTDQVYFNEINTIPGSFSFYLWEPTGVPFVDVLDELIEIARRSLAKRSRRLQSYDVNLLSARSLSGLKGAKS